MTIESVDRLVNSVIGFGLVVFGLVTAFRAGSDELAIVIGFLLAGCGLWLARLR